MSTKNQPTEEQHIAIATARSGEDFKVSAYAGAGKTTTLTLIGEALSAKRGLYLAFNKSIAEEAKRKFGNNVKCSTFHSLAYRSVPRYLTQKLAQPRLMPQDVAVLFTLSKYITTLPLVGSFDNVVTTEWDLGMLLIKSVDCFCRSSSVAIDYRHVLASMPKNVDIKSKQAQELSNILAPNAQQLWEYYLDPNTSVKISHDIYLKYWALMDPRLNNDFILFDEAQDADPIMLGIIKRQPCQKIYVGDKSQSIYGWRGAKNAMASLDIKEVHLTQSFRFGPEVASLANNILIKILGEKIPLVGNPKLDTQIKKVDSPDAYLVRTNSSAISLALACYSKNKRPIVQMDYKVIENQIKDISKLQNDQTLSTSSDFFGFKTYTSLLEYVEENKKCDIAPIVKLVESNTVPVLQSLLDKLQKIKEADADCMISTAHKAKGLEYPTVQLHGDFQWNEDNKKNVPLLEDSEAKLLYVAVTRAQNALDIKALQPLFDKLERS